MASELSRHHLDHQFSRRQLLGGLLSSAAAMTFAERMIPAVIAEEITKQRKQFLFVNQVGGLSQLESWDPQPGTNTGGPLNPIATSVPGIHVAEWLPHTSRQVHHLTILRSLSTGENDHNPGAYLLQTGRRQQTGFLYPTLACWANKELTPYKHPLPGYITVGETGREAAFLGVQYDPVKIEIGKPIDNLNQPAHITDIAAARRLLLRQKANARFQSQRGSADTQAYALSFDQALQLVANKTLFDLSQEPAKDHERYGTHPMGQQCLLARRLLEKGVTCVRVVHPGYDTHAENFNVHLDLLEQFDRPFACLIEDLAARGMLAHTVVAAHGEFGRTPTINSRMGRDHWSASWSAAFAGGGKFPAGVTIGKTNVNGTEVTGTKVTAPDLFHTVLTALGIDPKQEIKVEGQVIPLADPAGHAIPELLVG